MRLIIALLLLLSFSSAFAGQVEFEKEFVDRYKDKGIQNGKIIGLNHELHPFNSALHRIFEFNPALVDDIARAKGIIEKDDSLYNAHNLEKRRVIENRAKPLNNIKRIILYTVSTLAIFLGIASLCIYGYRRATHSDNVPSIKIFATAVVLAILLNNPYSYKGNGSITEALFIHAYLFTYQTIQANYTNVISYIQNGEVQTEFSEYKGASEHIAAYVTNSNLYNYSMKYLQSDKFFHRNFDPTDVYASPERYVHVNDKSIEFYMEPQTHNFKVRNLALHKGGSINLHYAEIPDVLSDKIKPLTIVAGNNLNDLGLWKNYETKLKENTSIKEQDIKALSYIFHNNTLLNHFKNEIPRLFIKQLKTAEFTESYKCESLSERRFDARKSLEKGYYEHNYCLVKDNGSIKLAASSGNKDNAIANFKEINDEIQLIRLEANKSMWHSFQFSKQNERLIEAAQRGHIFFLNNYAEIIRSKTPDAQFYKLINSNMSFTAFGTDFFIDDESMPVRKNDNNIINFADVFQEIVSSIPISQRDLINVDMAELQKTVITNNSNVADPKNNLSTIWEIISNIVLDIDKTYFYDGACKSDCLIRDIDTLSSAQKLGYSFISLANDIIMTNIALNFLSSKDTVKNAKASAKNDKGMLKKAYQIGKKISNLGSNLINGLANIFAPLSLLAVALYIVGFILTIIVPHILPSIALIADALIYYLTICIITFSPLLMLRMFILNDENNWKYFFLAVKAAFATIFLFPIIISTALILSTPVTNTVIEIGIATSYDLFRMTMETANIGEMIAYGFLLICWVVLLPYASIMLVMKMLVNLSLSLMRLLGLHTELFDKVYNWLNWLDNALSIVFPLLLLIKFGPKKGSISKIDKKKAEAKAKQKHSDTTENTTA